VTSRRGRRYLIAVRSISAKRKEEKRTKGMDTGASPSAERIIRRRIYCPRPGKGRGGGIEWWGGRPSNARKTHRAREQDLVGWGKKQKKRRCSAADLRGGERSGWGNPATYDEGGDEHSSMGAAAVIT